MFVCVLWKGTIACGHPALTFGGKSRHQHPVVLQACRVRPTQNLPDRPITCPPHLLLPLLGSWLLLLGLFFQNCVPCNIYMATFLNWALWGMSVTSSHMGDSLVGFKDVGLNHLPPCCHGAEIGSNVESAVRAAPASGWFQSSPFEMLSFLPRCPGCAHAHPSPRLSTAPSGCSSLPLSNSDIHCDHVSKLPLRCLWPAPAASGAPSLRFLLPLQLSPPCQRPVY